jgi:hypothetical protein
VASIALLALGGISVSYGVGAGAMAAVSGLCIHALYDSSTTVIEPLPSFDMGEPSWTVSVNFSYRDIN